MTTPRKTPPKTPQKPSEEPEAAPLKMVRRTDAARFLGLSVSSIKRLEKEEELIPDKIDEQKQRWYEISTLEAYRAERAGMPSPEVEKVVATIDAAASQADKSAKHVERTLALVFEPSETLLMLLKELLAESRAAEKELRAENLTLLTQLRDILKDQRAEDIEEKMQERKAQQRDMALAMVRDAIPIVISQLTGSKAAGNVVGVVRSLQPEQLVILKQSKLLTDEQWAALESLLTSDQKRGLSSQADTSEEEKESESD